MQERYVVARDGARLWSIAQGAGPPLVLCHGGPGLWDYLEPLASQLVAGATVVRWDQRGCGRSERRGPYTSAQFVEDLDDVRASFGYDRWIVGGHSWGATLALRYALAHPDRVSGLLC